MHEGTLVSPSVALVEPAGAGVARNDRQPCLLVAVHRDKSLRFGEQDGGHTSPAVVWRNVDLLDLVIHHHHESRYRVVDDGDYRVADSLRCAQSERLLSPNRDEIVGNVPQMAVAPSLVPDLRDCLRVVEACRTKCHRVVVG